MLDDQAAEALGEMQVAIDWHGRTLGVPLVQLKDVSVNTATTEAMRIGTIG